jgi:hypothetical protein
VNPRAVTLAVIAFASVVAVASLFEMLHTPTARVVFAAVFGCCVLVIAAGLYLMPERRPRHDPAGKRQESCSNPDCPAVSGHSGPCPPPGSK